MSNSSKQKWIYEVIIDKLPPFSLIPKTMRVPTQLALMEALGLAIAYYEGLEIKAMILGSLAILAVAISSQAAVYIGPAVRSLRSPTTALEREVMEKYKQTLFNKRRYELLTGFSVFVTMEGYFTIPTNKTLEMLLGQKPNITTMFFTSALLWEITYRIGLSVWTASASLRCSINLHSASKKRFGFGYTPYKEVNTLKHLNIINLAFLAGFSPLIPICAQDAFLTYFALAYSALIFTLSISAWGFLDRIPIYPPEVLKLFREGMYAYIGTSTKNKVPHVTPVIFVFDGKASYIVTSKISRKVANIRENNRVAMLIDVRSHTELMNNRAVLIKGKAKIFNLFDAILRFSKMFKLRRLFQVKYPHYMERYAEKRDMLPLAWRTTLFISRLLIRIDMEEFFYWRKAKQIYIPV